MIQAKNISKSYEKNVLSDLSFSLPQKGLVLIRGESGIGKTTLLRILAGLEKPDSGFLEKANDAIFSVVFQEPRLAEHLSLLENILLVKKERNKKKAMEILNALHLSEAAEKYPRQLSGGMKLRGAIARSLYYGGNVYLWDEPTKELDPENKKRVIEIIHAISKKALIVVITHDPDLKSENTIEL
jgi:ABC-type multidrug transport system ATPase subunit